MMHNVRVGLAAMVDGKAHVVDECKLRGWV
jgi:hypothetical protein